MLQKKFAAMDPKDFLEMTKTGNGFKEMISETLVGTFIGEDNESQTLEELSSNVVVEDTKEPDIFNKREDVQLTLDTFLKELKTLGMVDDDTAIATKYFRVFTGKKDKARLQELATILKTDISNVHALISSTSITVYNSEVAASIRYYRAMKNGSIKYKHKKGEVA